MAGLKEPHNKDNPIVFLDIRIGNENGKAICVQFAYVQFAYVRFVKI